MSKKEEEYLKRQLALGYVPSLDGLDEEDLDYVPSWAQNRQPQEPLVREYQPVDRGLAERIFKMFRRPFDGSWQMPNLDGPEYRQPLLPPIPGDDLERIQKLPDFPGQEKPGDPKDILVNYAAGTGANGTETKVWPASEGASKWTSTGVQIDPFGWFPQYDTGKDQPSNQQSNTTSTTPGRNTQTLWDDIWNSPEVINAQTPNEKRAAVNRILKERRGQFEAAYGTAFGDKAASQFENDRKFTLNSMGDYVSADQLKAFGWQNTNDNMVKDLNDTLQKYDITTPERIRHFLAQSAKESGKGYYTTETGDRNYFINNYWDDMEKRKELGNLSPEDAVNYRGGGYIQTTGRDNYQKFADEMKDDDIMKRGAVAIAEKYPWLASGFWWKNNNMNELIDSLTGIDHEADVDKVTDRVNPGTDSRAERKNYYKDWYTIIPD